MLRLLFLLALTNLSTCKVLNIPYSFDNDLHHAARHNDIYVRFPGEEIWVLDLKNEDWSSLNLRTATLQEEEDFEEFTGPLIANYHRRQLFRQFFGAATQNNPTSPPKAIAEEPKDMKKLTQEIFTMINKFALSAMVDPKTEITESDAEDSPSISVYFQGQFASVIVKVYDRQWHYFISPPSPLPSWFYQDHGLKESSKYIEIPKSVKEDLLPALLRLMRLFLSHPV